MTDPENAAEFRQTFLSFFPTIFSFANSLVPDQPAVKNIVWGAFLLLWNKWTDLDGEANRKAFLYIVIRNNCLGFLKQRQQQPPAPEAYLPDEEAGSVKIPTGSLPPEIVKELRDFADDFMLSQRPPEQV